MLEPHASSEATWETSKNAESKNTTLQRMGAITHKSTTLHSTIIPRGVQARVRVTNQNHPPGRGAGQFKSTHRQVKGGSSLWTADYGEIIQLTVKEAWTNWVLKCPLSFANVDVLCTAFVKDPPPTANVHSHSIIPNSTLTLLDRIFKC